MTYNRVRMVQLGRSNSDGPTRMAQLGRSNSAGLTLQLCIYQLCVKRGVTQDIPLLQALFHIISSTRNCSHLIGTIFSLTPHYVTEEVGWRTLYKPCHHIH